MAPDCQIFLALVFLSVAHAWPARKFSLHVESSPCVAFNFQDTVTMEGFISKISHDTANACTFWNQTRLPTSATLCNTGSAPCSFTTPFVETSASPTWLDVFRYGTPLYDLNPGQLALGAAPYGGFVNFTYSSVAACAVDQPKANVSGSFCKLEDTDCYKRQVNVPRNILYRTVLHCATYCALCYTYCTGLYSLH